MLVRQGDKNAKHTILTSKHGVDWQPQKPTEQTLYGIAYGNGKYVTVGDSGVILTSEDAENWTIQNSGTNLPLYDIVYGNKQFIIVGDSQIILRSDDGIS